MYRLCTMKISHDAIKYSSNQLAQDCLVMQVLPKRWIGNFIVNSAAESRHTVGAHDVDVTGAVTQEDGARGGMERGRRGQVGGGPVGLRVPRYLEDPRHLHDK